jgi:pyruvate/2-oxoglutarate dehydrogenase complex dihydrolipoamide dehydrogenase (E3) component
VVRLGVDVQRVEAIGPNVRVQLADGEAAEGSHLFLATGRQPNTDNLGLEPLGVRLDHGYVEVDDRLSTNMPNLWAVGDIRGGPAFTHTAYNDFEVLASLFLGDGTARRSRIIPYAVFTSPELGRVGLSEQQAFRDGRRIRIGKRFMAESGKARELGKTEGFIKVIIDAETDAILGATAICEQGSEVIQLFVELMNSGATAATALFHHFDVEIRPSIPDTRSFFHQLPMSAPATNVIIRKNQAQVTGVIHAVR